MKHLTISPIPMFSQEIVEYLEVALEQVRESPGTWLVGKNNGWTEGAKDLRKIGTISHLS